MFFANSFEIIDYRIFIKGLVTLNVIKRMMPGIDPQQLAASSFKTLESFKKYVPQETRLVQIYFVFRLLSWRTGFPTWLVVV